jgi:hypothetical protein
MGVQSLAKLDVDQVGAQALGDRAALFRVADCEATFWRRNNADRV